jgi:hypothetical protein
MADSTLAQIRTKVRRLTRAPSDAQLTTAEIDQYINTFVLYDFPEHLRLFNLRTTHTFYTQPGQDFYPTDQDSFGAFNTTNPLYNFNNRFITVHDPVYMSGVKSFFSQSREQFFNIYPMNNNIMNTGLSGDGVTQQFSGIISPPGFSNNTTLLQYNVVLTSVDVNGAGIALTDRPVIDQLYGNNTLNGNLYPVGTVPALPPVAVDATNTVNYQTGAFTVTFLTPPANGLPISYKVVPLINGIPQALLFYDGTFTVRPIPDGVYPISFEAYIRPTELLLSSQEPQLQEWWQYLAYGAAKKVFEDRMDMDSVQSIMPEFNNQQRLILRRTIVQNTNQRTATIYTEQTSLGANFNNFGGGLL